ncbi:MAG: hypothetical protein AAB354_12935 [candidate division KSB1 bacterium]
MTQTITLELPDVIFQPAQRMAEATRRSLTEVLVGALRASLPPVEGLPSAQTTELIDLESLSDDALQQIMISRVPVEQQRKLSRLLRKKKISRLTVSEQNNLNALQHEADLVMLRKARAAILLRFRGHRLPTLSELRKLTFSLK